MKTLIAMPERDELMKAVDSYETILRQSAGLRDGQTDRRREAVQLRRVISQRIAEINAHGDAFFEGSSVYSVFRSEIAKMRSAVAYHQASWPIVSIRPDDLSYQASVAAVREANRSFIAWIRSASSHR